MFFYNFVFFVISIYYCASSANVSDYTKCGRIAGNTKIIGGNDAVIGKYPWIAILRYQSIRGFSFVVDSCAGSLISYKHVITAAHCIYIDYNFKLYQIILGEYDTTSDIDCLGEICADPVKMYLLKKVIIHPKYISTNFNHDIAIVVLKETVKLTDWISPICLPFGEEFSKNSVGEMAEVIGWGLTDSRLQTIPTILQHVAIPILDTGDCGRLIPNMFTLADFKIICAGAIGKDSCSGDSGGPLQKIFDTTNGPRYFVIGLVSYGTSVCGGRYPAVYTDVEQYSEWIIEIIS